MIASDDFARHEEAWLLLPWLANGRLSPVERERVEEHLRGCGACSGELAFQRLMCKALAEPDRVTYASGPSFRKLMDRIDGAPASKARETGKPAKAPPAISRIRPSSRRGTVALWRPPGLAWAASFVLAIGVSGFVVSAYRSQPTELPAIYMTHTDPAKTDPNVLEIAFDRSLTIGEVEELLRADGARLVEGPDSSGIFGVTPVAGAAKSNAAGPSRELQLLSGRLRADPRVRWVQPIAMDNEQAGSPRGR